MILCSALCKLPIICRKCVALCLKTYNCALISNRLNSSEFFNVFFPGYNP